MLPDRNARMDSTHTPAAPPPAARVPPPGVGTWLAWGGALAYTAILIGFMGAYAGGSDSSGYLNNARMLAQGRVTIPMRVLPGLAPDSLPGYAYVPLGFIPNLEQATLTPTYPTGVPLLVMGLSEVVGWELGPGLAMGIHSLLGLWLSYRLARALGLEAGWAGLGAVMLAVSPLYLFLSLHLMSDLPALVWVTAAVYLAWGSRDRPWLALPAGLALGVAVLVRPTNLLALVPLGFALGVSFRRWLLLVLGGLPAAVFLGAFNFAAYGRIVTTGYGFVGDEFSRSVIPLSLRHYALWMPVMLTPLIVLALGLPLVRRSLPRLKGLLITWALIFPLFYVANIHTHETWWYLRFLLPAFPPLIIAALLAARALAGRLSLPLRPAGLAMAGALVVVHGAAWTLHFGAYRIGSQEKVYADGIAWMRPRLPANAVVAAMQTSGALFYYTDYAFFRWDMVAPAECDRIVDACRRAHRPLYAMLFPFEVEDAPWKAFEGHLTGHWTQVGAVSHISIWRLEMADAVP